LRASTRVAASSRSSSSCSSSSKARAGASSPGPISRAFSISWSMSRSSSGSSATSASSRKSGMSPSAGAAAWPKPTRARSRRLTRFAVTGAVAFVLGDTLGGAFFLWSMHADPRQASPLTLTRYGYYYGDRAEVRRRLWASSGLAAALLAASGTAALLPRKRALHGEARFASRAEIAAAGLIGKEGVILGRLGRRYLRLAGQQGVALAAPPRAGKGTGVVVPNALSWPGSLVCVDIKRENWTITAGHRAALGHGCYLFDP